MTDYITLQNRIAKEVRFVDTAAQSDIAPDIRNAIRSAIKYYENDRFWFNESQWNQDTASNAEYIDLPAEALEIDSLRLTEPSGSRRTLNPATFQWIDGAQSGSPFTGPPSRYCVYGRRLRLWPVPDAAYTLTLSGLQRLDDLVVNTDANAWTNECEELIRFRAKADLYANILHDPQQAAALSAYADQVLYPKFIGRATQLISSGRVEPQWW